MIIRAAAGLLLTLALLAGSTVARAEERGTVSFDGEHWGSSVTAPLWSDEPRWVPGDRRTVSLWLRNDAPVPTRFALAVVVQSADDDPALVPALTAIAEVGSARLAVGPRPVALPETAAGDRRRVDLTLSLPAASGDADQLRRAEIRVEVSAPEAPAPVPRLDWPVVAIAAGLLAAAVGLVGLDRRHRREVIS